MKQRIIKNIPVIFMLILFGLFSIASGSSSTNATTESEEETKATVSSEPTTTTTEETSQTTTLDPYVGTKTSFKDLKLGETGKSGDIYINLQYAKISSSLPTMSGKTKVKKGNQVLLAFFELYNGGDSPTGVNPSDITCYVDGVQASDVESYIKVYADGIYQYYNETLDGGCQMLSVQDFEIPKKWEKIELFYESDCIWTISPDDTSKEKFKNHSVFEIDYSHDATEKGTVIYSDDYELTYNGIKIYHNKNYFANDYYAVFKFRIKNTSDEALDTSLMGYEMRCYRNNYYLGDASYTLNKKIDKHIDIHDIDSIEAGKSADVYVAFKIPGKTGSFYMIFDDGYISEHYCASVYATVEKKKKG